MILELQGRNVPDCLLKAISRLTDSAELIIGSVVFDESSGLLSFKVRRLLRPRKFSLKALLYPQAPNNTVECSLTFRNIVRAEIAKRNLTMGETCMIMFGVEVTGESVSIVSAEEDRGEPCFELFATFSELAMRMEDTE